MLLTNWLKPLLFRRFRFLRVSTSNRRRQTLQTRSHFVSDVERLEDRLLLSFHGWKIDEVFSSPDGTIQFIELKNASDFQTQLSSQSFTTNANPFTFPSSLPGVFSANTTFLMATAGFSELPGAITPDYIIPDNFFSVTGDTLDYASGTDVFTFTSGQLPLDGVASLFADLTTGTNSPKNFAGTSGSIELPPTVTLSLSGSPLAEAEGVATVTATLSAALGQDVTVELGFSGTATIVDDYAASETQIVITAGATTGSIALTAVQDALGEVNETITVDITGVTNGDELETQQVIATITDDDDLFTDFGDAPLPYPTTLAEDGAWHAAIGLTLGFTRDFESDGTHSAVADADGADEDGVTFGTMKVGALGATVTVNVRGAAGKLDAWIDFNGDGAWGGPGEQIFASQDVVVGDNNLTFNVHSFAIAGTTYARFRVSTVGGLGVIGTAADGEVEDYQVTINNPAATDGVFGSQNVISTEALTADSVVAADMDSDGDMDVLSASRDDDKIAWYENDGSQNFTEHTISTTADGAFSVFSADVDGDGDMDVLSASQNDDKIAWYENDGSQNFTVHTISTAADSALEVFAADLDGDGDLDVLSASFNDNKIAWYENDGSQNFIEHTISTAADSAFSVFAADVDSDGDMDVLSASQRDDTIAWYENDDSENFTEHTISTTADGAISVFSADVDGDGDLDVLSASYFGDTIAWYENDGGENFTPHTISTAAVAAYSVFAADVDGDGNMDVLSASQNDDKIAWYKNDGNGNFTPHTISTAADKPQSVFAADMDGDGDMDVLSASREDHKIAWYENLGNEVGSTVTLSIDNVSSLEDGTFTFTITSDTTASDDITVVVNTADFVGQATVGSDYTAIVNQTATITTGNTSTTITVTVNDDAIVEDNQTFEVNLLDAKIGGVTDLTLVVIGDGAGMGTIENNDSATLSINNVTETETDSDFAVQASVTLSAEVEGGIDVAYSSALGTADATDVTVQGTSLIFAGTSGETQTIDVVIIGDDIEENSETFTITLGDVTGTSTVQDAAITTGAVSDGLIIDDDAAVPTIDLDVDANGEAGALTDGVLIVRYLFGVTGTQLTDGALGTGAVRTDPAEIIAFLEPGLTTILDVDANGEATALTDGVLIVRYLFGVTGTQLTDGALGTGSLRTDPVEIIAFLDGFLPAAASASLVVSTQDTLIANYDAPAVSVGIPGNVDTGPNFAQDTFNDASTTNVVTTTSDVVLPTTVSGPLLYPALTEEESDDEALAEEAPVIVPEEQAELEILFGDLDGSLQDELLTV
jgi:hypothetical protein